MMIAHHLIDLGQVFIGELNVERCNRLNEVVRSRTCRRRPCRGSSEQRSRQITFSSERRPLIGRLPVGPDLTQDGDTNLGIESDLVSDADAFQRWRTLQRTILANEAGKQIPDTAGGELGVHPDVVQGWAGGLVRNRIGNQDNLKIQASPVVAVQDNSNDVSDLLPHCHLEIVTRHLTQAR